MYRNYILSVGKVFIRPACTDTVHYCFADPERELDCVHIRDMQYIRNSFMESFTLLLQFAHFRADHFEIPYVWSSMTPENRENSYQELLAILPNHIPVKATNVYNRYPSREDRIEDHTVALSKIQEFAEEFVHYFKNNFENGQNL